jgi:hypothetical protein
VAKLLFILFLTGALIEGLAPQSEPPLLIDPAPALDATG